MKSGDIFTIAILNLFIWGLCYKLLTDNQLVPAILIGYIVSTGFGCFYAAKANRYKQAFSLISHHSIEHELSRLAERAATAINVAADEQRRVQLGCADSSDLHRANATRAFTMSRFRQLQRAAIASGNPLVKASIKDYL